LNLAKILVIMLFQVSFASMLAKITAFWKNSSEALMPQMPSDDNDE